MLPGLRSLDALAAIHKELAEGGEKALHYLMVEALAGKPQKAVYLLVIDLFEELFTLCDDEAERRATYLHLPIEGE